MRTELEQLSLLDLERREQPHKSDEERVVDIAARLLDELDEGPPVNLDLVASYRDITRIDVVSMAQAGSLAPQEDGLVMRLRASDSRRRRRFTGFHEVGHTFQPGYREKTLFRCAEPSISRPTANSAEALADVAAAELLMPQAFFEPRVTESDFGIESVVELSDAFEASVQATAYRFAAFWPEPTLVMVLEPGFRKDEDDDPDAIEKLRVVSAWPHPRGEWPFVPKNKSADQDGALVRAFHGEVVRERSGLEELGLDGPESVDLAARAFTYKAGDEPRRRVLALFRRVGTTYG